MGKCFVVGAGDIDNTLKISPASEDFVVCADAGYNHRNIFSREADFVVGDFDSLGYVPKTENKSVAKAEKDETDMLLACLEGLKRGYTDFTIFGALGGDRFEHSVANIELLIYLSENGARCRLVHKGKILEAVKNSELNFSPEMKGYISVFSLRDESRGVTIENLKYEVKDISLFSKDIFGVSNEFIGKSARVRVEDGILLVIYDYLEK